MKKLAFIFILVFLTSFLCVLPVFPLTTEVSRDEVVEEAARLTGLSKDIMELLYEEAPSLFVNVEETAFRIKMLHLFASARDEEAILELFNRFVDELRPALLPEVFNTFITAVKAYKTSLEVIRDYVFIPAFDESIYQSYRSSRLIDWKRGDTSAESISTSFEVATTRWGSGYYVVRDKMYRELLRRKGYNENLLGAKMVKHLRSQIDQFWMDALELRFQQEILSQNEDAIATALWQEAATDLARLR